MEEMIRNKIRTYGAIFIIMLAFLIITLVLMQFKEKSITAVKLKLVYSEITQAGSSAIRDYEKPSKWNLKPEYKNADILENNFFKYFSVNTNCIHEQKGCFSKENYKSLKSKNTKLNLSDIPGIKLKNGTAISVETLSSCKQENEACATIFVDLNGPDEPNALGKDLFLFVLRNNSSSPVVAYGEDMNLKELKRNKEKGCNSKSQLALYCSAVIKKSNWKIEADYPW